MTVSNNQLMLPNYKDNTLNITLKTYCSAQPYISSILLGNYIGNIKYL